MPGLVLSVRTTARGACFADYDNDGKVDAFVVNLGGRGTLVHNVSTNTGHWIAIKLTGTKSNRDGIGAKVEVFAGEKHWTAERVAGSGYLSQDDGRLHFGLGLATVVDSIVIHWPGGTEQRLEKIRCGPRDCRGGTAVRRCRQIRRCAAAVAFAMLTMVAAMGSDNGVRAAVRAARTGEHLNYASPVEMLFSPDGRGCCPLPGQR